MGKKNLSDEVSHVLLDQAHNHPQIITPTRGYAEKSGYFVAAWTAARKCDNKIKMGDVVKFYSKLKRSVKKSKVPQYAMDSSLAEKFLQIQKYFKEEVPIEVAAKTFEPQVSSILGKCLKHRLLVLLQADSKLVFEPEISAEGLQFIAKSLSEQGFEANSEQIGRFVRIISNAIKRGTLPSFVEKEEYERYKDLLSLKEPLRKKDIDDRAAYKRSFYSLHASEQSRPLRSRKRRLQNAVVPATNTERSHQGLNRPVGLSEAQKILIMRLLIKDDHGVFQTRAEGVPVVANWKDFFTKVFEQDDSMSESQVKIFVKHLKERNLRRNHPPNISRVGNKVYCQLQAVYNDYLESYEEQKKMAIIGRYILRMIRHFPELTGEEEPKKGLSSPKMRKLSLDVSNEVKEKVPITKIVKWIRSWRRYFLEKDKVPFFAQTFMYRRYLEKAFLDGLMDKEEKRKDDLVLGARTTEEIENIAEESNTAREEGAADCDHNLNKGIKAKLKIPVNPPEMHAEEPVDNNDEDLDITRDELGDSYFLAAGNDTVDTFGKKTTVDEWSHLSDNDLGMQSEWDGYTSVSEGELDDFGDIFNPFNGRTETQASNTSVPAQHLPETIPSPKKHITEL